MRVIGSVVPIYNIPGMPAGKKLNLTTEIIARIFRKCTSGFTVNPADVFNELGLSLVSCQPNSITVWDDPDIIALNPDLPSPVGSLTVVVREDGSGTTEIWRKSLSAFETAFSLQIGEDSTNTLEEGAAAGDNAYNADVVKRQKNSGVAAYVLANEWTIGYSVLGEALVLGLEFADIIKDGVPVTATALSTSNALVERGLQFAEPVDRLNADVNNALGTSAWPIAGYTYFVIRKNTLRPGATCSNRIETFKFIEWFYTAGELIDTISSDLGFSTIPNQVRDVLLTALQERMLCEGSPVFVPPSNDTELVNIRLPDAYKPVYDLYEVSYRILRPEVSLLEVVSGAVEIAPLDFLSSREAGVYFYLGNGPANETMETQYVQEIAESNEFINLPYVAVGMGVVFSLCSGSELSCSQDLIDIDRAGLVMNYSTLAGVLDGSILTWDDAAIAELNPTLAAKLPSQAIQVVTPDVQDTLSLRFSAELRKVKPDFDLFGSAASINETTTQRIRSLIATTDFAIGYTSLAQEVDEDAIAYVRVIPNKVGASTADAVKPSASAFTACAAGAYIPELSAFDLTSTPSALCYPLTEVINIATRFSYSGDSCVGGVGGGAQSAKFLSFLFTNVLDPNAETNVETPLESQFLGVLLSDPQVNLENKQKLLDISCNGLSILNPTENKNLIPEAFIVIMILFVCVHIVMSLWFSRKISKNAAEKIVRNSSPIFLQEMLVGSVIGMATIIPLSVQDEESGFLNFQDTQTLDVVCQLQPITYTLGFALLYSSIWLKTWRLNKIFNNVKLRKMRMENNKLQLYQLVYLLIIVALNIAWFVIAPLKWVRVISRNDTEGKPLESYGYCTEDPAIVAGTTTFLIIFGVAILLSVLCGLYLLYTIWFIPNEFNESKWIGFSLITAAQSFLVAASVAPVIGNNPTARYAIMVFVVVATMFFPILFIFVPKLSGIKGKTQGSFLDGAAIKPVRSAYVPRSPKSRRYTPGPTTKSSTGTEEKENFSYSREESV